MAKCKYRPEKALVKLMYLGYKLSCRGKDKQ